MTYPEIVEYAKKRHSKMDSTELKESVYITLRNGSTFFLNDALSERNGDWMILFWIYSPPLILHNDEIKYINKRYD